MLLAQEVVSRGRAGGVGMGFYARDELGLFDGSAPVNVVLDKVLLGDCQVGAPREEQLIRQSRGLTPLPFPVCAFETP